MSSSLTHDNRRRILETLTQMQTPRKAMHCVSECAYNHDATEPGRYLTPEQVTYSTAVRWRAPGEWVRHRGNVAETRLSVAASTGER